MVNIAILEDDKDQAQLLRRWLTENGHTVSHADNGSDFLALIRSTDFDMFILDWQLPDLSGIDVVRHIRLDMECTTPVLFATQKNQEDDIVKALNSGADDYLVKPLRRRELMARVTALQRRNVPAEEPETLELGPIHIDTNNHIVRVHGETIKLTHKDYLLATCLIKNFGKVLSREFLLKEVWGIDSDLHTRTVDVHVSRLRRSLKIGPDIGIYIKTIYQHGYRLEKMEE
jgi:DNA-binding response OmpR family regulator